ncbi:carbohydrate-binding module family 1 protein [Plicaturopsis crispa FD-325 SS-3]|nr:carbohydrate-binding module family 1 protein [Plicaturopsis crispa FD-325 SS-3]
MKYFAVSAFVSAAFSSARAGTTVWSGSFNAYPTVAAFDNWSWADEVGEYQWYIHGTGPTSDYLALDPSYKNPADTAETNGLRITIDSTATWNSQMERTELIPQTTANLGTGELFYHFSLQPSSTNPPNSADEHQIFFFESHFTEIKYGVAPNPTELQWMVQEVPLWSTAITPDTWYNFAYDIDFTAGTIGLYASTNGDPLTLVVSPVSVSASTNSEDWHVGVLRIENGADTEQYFVSGVYIEEGPITTAIGDGSAGSSSSASAPPASSTVASTQSASAVSSASSSTASVALQSHYGQCGGTGYTGPTTCASPYTCVAVSAPYYYQCQ